MLILLNQPWREMERLQRRQKVCRVLASLCWFLALLLLGIAIGKML